MFKPMMMACALGFGVMAGCIGSAPNPDDSADVDDGNVDKADGIHPSGTFDGPTHAKIGQFTSLTLGDDKTFDRLEVGLCPGGGTCAPNDTSGTYKFTSSGSNHYIRFYVHGTFLDRYGYTLTSTKLTLRSVTDESTFVMSVEKTPAPSGKGGFCDDGDHTCKDGLVCCDTSSECVDPETGTCDNS